MTQSASDVRQRARGLRAGGWVYKSIAAEFGVSYGTVQRWVRGVRPDMDRPPEVAARISATKAKRRAAWVSSVARGACGTPGCGDSDCRIRYGQCHCGCGEKAPCARQSERRRSYVKDEPHVFVAGHNGRFGTLRACEDGARLREAREERGITARQLALALGFGEGVISELEGIEGYGVSLERAEAVADALERPLEELFTAEVGPLESVGRRTCPPIPRPQRYDGRHFKEAEFRERQGKALASRWKEQRDAISAAGALTVEEFAREVCVTPDTVRGYIEQGHLPARRVDGPGPGTWAIDTDPVEFEREWARSLSTDAKRRSWLNPDHAVKRWRSRGIVAKLAELKGLSEREAEAVLRERVKIRRESLMPRRRGRRPGSGPPEYHLEWETKHRAALAELEEEFCLRRETGLLDEGERPPTNWQAALAVAEADFAQHPERWSNYARAPSDSLALHPDCAQPAANRVLMAIKRLQTAHTVNSAAQFLTQSS